jgi:DNA-binding HxlR family transcriptional regulator
MKRSAAMRLLGGRWRLLLVSYLLDGPKRFNDLRRCYVPLYSDFRGAVCLSIKWDEC